MIYYDKKINYFTSFKPSQKEIVNKIYKANFKRLSVTEMLFDLQVAYLPRWGWSPALLLVSYLILVSGIVLGFLFPEPILYAMISIPVFIWLSKARIMDVILHAIIIAFVTSIAGAHIGLMFLAIILIGRYRKDKIPQDNMRNFRGIHDGLEFIFRSAKLYPMKKTKTLTIAGIALKKRYNSPYDIIETAYMAGLKEAEGTEETTIEDVREFLYPIFKGVYND